MTSTPQPRFREATAGDADALTALGRAANQRSLAHIFPPERYPFPTQGVRAHWLDVLGDPAVRLGISEDADGLTSYVAFDDDLHLAVRPDQWGKGLARNALEWALEQAPIRRLWCLEDNGRALTFYERVGWRRTGRQQPSEFPPFPVQLELVRG